VKGTPGRDLDPVQNLYRPRFSSCTQHPGPDGAILGWPDVPDSDQQEIDMAHPLSPDPRPTLGGLHAGWASFGALVTGIARSDAARRGGLVTQMRGMIRRFGYRSREERAIADMPAYLLADMGLDPREGRAEPVATDLCDAAAWVGIKTGMHPRS
jgi:hypothetical protein